MSDTKGNSNVKQAVPFFMVAQMDKSLEFYVNGLGFELKNKWEPKGIIEWCWLQLDNTSIMLQEYRNNILNENPGKGVCIYFICEDALTIYQQITFRGLVISEPFVGNNMWVVGVKDPDGYNLFFESPTDVPEETKYSDWVKTIGTD